MRNSLHGECGSCGANRSFLLLALVFFLLGAGPGMADEGSVSYVTRWMVTESSSLVKPPLWQLWTRSPVWFEQWGAKGRSESPSRRLALTPAGLVTLIKGDLYVLRREDGSTLWSLPLEGDEFFDWKLLDSTLVYSAVDWGEEATAPPVARRSGSRAAHRRLASGGVRVQVLSPRVDRILRASAWRSSPRISIWVDPGPELSRSILQRVRSSGARHGIPIRMPTLLL